MYIFINKVEGLPDYNTVMEALTTIHGDLKTVVTSAQTTATTLQQAAITSQQAILINQDTNEITKEVAEAGKASAVILQETNNIKAIQSTPPLKSSYASVLSSNLAPTSRPIIISTQTPSLI